jgi:hypothetical protein
MSKNKKIWGFGKVFWLFVLFFAWSPFAFAGAASSTLPDFLVCGSITSVGTSTFFLSTFPDTADLNRIHYYSIADPTAAFANGGYVIFTPAGAAQSTSAAGNCASMSIAQLTTSGQAKNFGNSTTTITNSTTTQSVNYITSSSTDPLYISNTNEGFAFGYFAFVVFFFGIIWLFAKKR